VDLAQTRSCSHEKEIPMLATFSASNRASSVNGLERFAAFAQRIVPFDVLRRRD